MASAAWERRLHCRRLAALACATGQHPLLIGPPHLLLLGQERGAGQARDGRQLAVRSRAGGAPRGRQAPPPHAAARPRQAHQAPQIISQRLEPVSNLPEGQAAGEARRASAALQAAAALAAARAAALLALHLQQAGGHGGGAWRRSGRLGAWAAGAAAGSSGRQGEQRAAGAAAAAAGHGADRRGALAGPAVTGSAAALGGVHPGSAPLLRPFARRSGLAGWRPRSQRAVIGRLQPAARAGGTSARQGSAGPPAWGPPWPTLTQQDGGAAGREHSLGPARSPAAFVLRRRPLAAHAGRPAVGRPGAAVAGAGACAAWIRC